MAPRPTQHERPQPAVALVVPPGAAPVGEELENGRDLLRALADGPLRLRVVAPEGRDGIADGLGSRVRVETLRGPRPRGGRRGAVVAAASRVVLRPDVRRHLADVDVAHLPFGGSALGVPRDIGLVLGQFEAPRPPVGGLRGGARSTLTTISRLTRRGPVRHTRMFVVPSDHVALAVLAHPHVAADAVRVIPPGVDGRVFRPGRDPRGDAVVRYVAPGRTVDRDRLVSAVGALRGDRPGLRLVLVGDVPAAGLPAWAEVRADPGPAGRAELDRRALLVCETQRDLPWSTRLAEAMACGAPVASVGGGGLPELLGEIGIALDATSAPALAASLGRALDAGPRTSTLGLRRAVSFERRLTVAAHEELYVEVAAEVARRRRVG